jgi:hypothetical protein
MRPSAIVVIPIHQTSLTDEEGFALRHNCAVLSARHVALVCPPSLARVAEQLRSGIGVARSSVEVFGEGDFLSTETYSHLLTSVPFYRRFQRFTHMLVCQLDALVFEDSLDMWMHRGFSYVGAPWFEGYAEPVNPPRFLGVGNGGLSLRRIRDFLHFLSRPRILRLPGEADGALGIWTGSRLERLFLRFNFHPLSPRVNEDYFWGILAPRTSNSFTVPDPKTAALFSFEVAPRVLYEMTGRQLPFGCHAWERYDKPFWLAVLADLGFRAESHGNP